MKLECLWSRDVLKLAEPEVKLLALVFEPIKLAPDCHAFLPHSHVTHTCKIVINAVTTEGVACLLLP